MLRFVVCKKLRVTYYRAAQGLSGSRGWYSSGQPRRTNNLLMVDVLFSKSSPMTDVWARFSFTLWKK